MFEPIENICKFVNLSSSLLFDILAVFLLKEFIGVLPEHLIDVIRVGFEEILQFRLLLHFFVIFEQEVTH